MQRAPEPPRPAQLVIPHRIPELDGLRGLAAVLVVFHHIATLFPVTAAPHSLRLWLQISRLGWLGVDVFFALSGFLITTTLLATRGRPHFYRNFYMRRVLRLTAPYLIILALVAVLIPGSGRFILCSLLYLSNLSVFFGVPLAYGPLWSLAVEEHFYLIWPWLVRFLNRNALLATALAVCLITPAVRVIAHAHTIYYNPYFSWYHFDGILWGAILAILTATPAVTRQTITRWSSAFTLAGALTLLVVLATSLHAHQSIAESTLVFSAVALLTTGVIGFILTGRLPAAFALFRVPILRYLGDISYWMYLFHLLVILQLVRFIPRLAGGWLAYWLLVAVVFAASSLTGSLIRRFVELPVLSLKSRFR